MVYQIIKYSEINPDILQECFRVLSLKYLKDNSIIQEKIQEFLPVYPNISIWYEKVIREINEDSSRREMFIVLSNESNELSISGLMILKNHLDEKKICTLRVKDSHQGKGIGTKLFEYAFEYLNTKVPLITVPEESVDIFSRIFDKYGFKQTESRSNLYREGKVEYIYNGYFE
ncbi:Acetyltransferase, GNAT [Mannheimia varigena USDA-ARS-USMARC-1388]|uniref:GNAT family N-acetyltransferase n=1 Tax=Mannheimia varigena TaxID=85404 RepID=UPI0003E383AA|nr:GNAT family N-acetyltransferase [Mannheimia varigena]AHG78679.1 Acetyltransferase, GNAT [Mannheimia varigena USDA-ARS-USMARC-1388]